MLPLKSIGFLMMFFGLCSTSLFVPILGVANYMLVYQIAPEHTWWYKPIAHLGIRYSMTSAVCMMFGMVISLPRLPGVKPLVNLWDAAAILLLMVVILCDITGLPPSPLSLMLTEKYLKMMVFVFCLTRLTTTKQNFTIVIWVLVIGSLYIGYDAWTAPRGAFSRGRLEFIGGPDFRHSSGLSAHMASMLPIIGACFMVTPSWKLRAIIAVSGALTVNTIILCRTRSAFVGLAVGGVIALIFAPKRMRLKTYLAIGIAAVCAYALTDVAFWERMSTLNDRTALQSDKSAMGRVDIWKAAGKIVTQYPLGVGIGNFETTMQKTHPHIGRRAAHNTFVLCVTELGVQGLCLFLIIVAASFHSAWRCVRRADQTHDPAWTRFMGYGLILSMVTGFGAQMFTERLYTEAFWWILALPTCLHRVVVREISEKRLALHNGQYANLQSWQAASPSLSPYPPRGAFA